MDQIKIGKFIAKNRKEKSLTQQQLADKLNISKNAVSKWERGLNMPDIALLQQLCDILDISIDELFAGEQISMKQEENHKDHNSFDFLKNSSFTLQDRIDYFKKKWIKEHKARILVFCIVWFSFVIILKQYEVEGYIIGIVSGIYVCVSYLILYHQMMIYVENNAYPPLRKEE